MKTKTHKNKYFQGYKKLKNIKMFEQFVNEFDLKDDQEDPIEDDGYKNHPKAKYVITKEDAQKLVAADEDNLAPGEKGMDDAEFEKSCDEITGMTMAEYAEFRWPEEPQKQFEMSLDILKNEATVKTDDGLYGKGNYRD